MYLSFSFSHASFNQSNEHRSSSSSTHKRSTHVEYVIRAYECIGVGLHSLLIVSIRPKWTLNQRIKTAHSHVWMSIFIFISVYFSVAKNYIEPQWFWSKRRRRRGMIATASRNTTRLSFRTQNENHMCLPSLAFYSVSSSSAKRFSNETENQRRKKDTCCWCQCLLATVWAYLGLSVDLVINVRLARCLCSASTYQTKPFRRWPGSDFRTL